MKSMNKVQLIGWLGQDPQFLTLKDGSLMAKIRLATNTWIPQPEGEPKKITDWHEIRMYGKERVERLKNYLLKGSHVLVEGRVVYRTYEDKLGHTRYVTQIQANYLVDLDR